MTNNSTTPATSNKRQEFAAALAERVLRALPADTTDEELAKLMERVDEIVAPAAKLVLAFIRPPPAPSEPAVEVVAEFTLGGRAFEAVRVHREGEKSVVGDEAIRRADVDGRVVRSEEDWKFVYEHRGELPSALNDFWLATARPDPGYPRNVSYLFRDSREWYGYWHYLGRDWDRCALVLRRRT